jgi:hypothetical protein
MAKAVPCASEFVATHFGKHCHFNLFYFPLSKAHRHTAENGHGDRGRSESHTCKISPLCFETGKYLSASNCIDVFTVNFFNVKVTN